MHDYPAGRRGLDVARTDRGRRIDDHGRKTAGLHEILHHALGQHLAALVGADRLLDAERARFVGGRAVAAKREGGDAAGIDHALDAGPKRLLHDDAGAFHVDAQQVVGNGRPKPVVGSRMDEVADACERRGDRVAIAHVALHHLTVGVDEVGAHAGAPYQRPHRITGAPERLHEGGSDESACACDQDGAGVRTGRLDHHATDSLGSRGGWSIPCNTIKATTPHEFRDPPPGIAWRARPNPDRDAFARGLRCGIRGRHSRDGRA